MPYLYTHFIYLSTLFCQTILLNFWMFAQIAANKKKNPGNMERYHFNNCQGISKVSAGLYSANVSPCYIYKHPWDLRIVLRFRWIRTCSTCLLSVAIALIYYPDHPVCAISGLYITWVYTPPSSTAVIGYSATLSI